MVFSAIPQVITEDRASGAQFIDGSLKFDSSKGYCLKRTYNSAGNRKFWTWSAWVKRGSIANSNVNYSLFGAYYNSSSRDVIRIGGEVQDKLSYQNGSAGDYDSSTTNAVLRDTGWYHFVVSVDLNQGTQTDRVKIYVNGELQSKLNDAQATRNSFINWEGVHFIGARSTDGNPSAPWDGEISQCYFIDGQALGPENFGYTDPLTNTWRPKKFEHLSSAIATQYSGASALTWDDNPIGSIYTLSNGNRTATASGGSGYTGADVWSNAIPANSTTAWTLEITNSDGVGGWYFTDSQTPSGTHPDERTGNMVGLRNQDTDAAFRGTFATANGYANSGNQLSLLSCHTWGSKRVDFVVYRPASGNGKVWVKNNGSSTWVGGGNPSDTSSTPSFNIPDGNTYFGYTFYDRTDGDQIATFDGDGSIQQKLGPNSFYLPLDGKTPIGKDQSGKGNDWTPVKFGGSNSLEKATGAIPILNTNGGGTVARSGVRTERETYTVTASGGKYYLDGVETPTLNFLRGGTYIFDYTGATSHPFKFSTTSDGTHGGGSEYTDGTNTATTNVMKITVPHNAPDTLYYYCSAHSGMGSSINVTTDVLKADPYAWKCVLALPLLGSKNDVSANINVNSTTKTTSIAGNAASSTDSSDLYGGSFIFDGNSDYVEITPTSGSTLADNTAPYTIEFFFSTDSTRMSDNTYDVMWSTSSGLTIAKWRSGISNKVYFESDGNATGWNVQSQENISANTWYHFAAVRDGSTIKTFLDGVLQGTATATYTAGAETWWRVGGQSANSSTHDGYIQDFRVYDGVAKYSEDFTRVSTSPDVLPDTPSGVSGKSKLTKITDGAVHFDGTSEQHMDAGSALINTNNSFCVEAFAYLNNNPTSSDMGMICSQYASGTPAGRMLYGFQDGYLALRINGTAVQLQSAAGTTVANRWYHTAWTWDGTTHRLFLDGILVDSSTTVPAPYTGTNTEIGGNASLTGFDIHGYISNFRIVTGSAVYTEDFTPPTEKLTNITNTSLLCCQSSTQPSAAVVGPRVSGVNNGTGWSSSLTSDSLFRSGFPGWKAFNGTTKSSTNDCAATPQTAGQGFTFTFGGGVPFTTLQMQCDPNGSGGATVKANGVDITSQLTNGSLTNTTITGVTSPLTSLSLVSRNGDAGYLGSITIDGTMLVDPLIRNSSSIVATNFNPSTDDINTIRGQETGYATWNPLTKGSRVTLSDGNLDIVSTASTGNAPTMEVVASFETKSGKYYVEWTNISNRLPTLGRYAYGGTQLGVYSGGINNSLGGTTSGGSFSFTSSDVIALAVDFDNKIAYVYKNNLLKYTANYTTDVDLFFKDIVSSSASGGTSNANFGQKPFKFPPPDGFQPLNLSTVQPEKVIARPDQYVGTTLYTGSGETVSPRTIELPQAADLVWAKSRDRASSHQIADTVRGDNSVLQSNTNSTARNPTTQYNGGGISTIDGKTISLVKGSTNQANNENLNATGQRGVVWSWKAGGSSNTFNIDDVGYANASDVNMNVGALNSAQFLKGQVWSGLMSAASGSFDQAASRAFDGFLQTDPNRLRTSGNQVLVTMTLSTPVTVSSQIKVHAEPGYNSSCTVTVGGVTHTSSTGALHTFNVSGSLTQMTLQSTQSGGRTYMEGMEIDGKLLVDDNITVNAPSVDNTGCSVGTKQGFSIISYNATGSNLRVSHGLSERPGLIILKTVHSTSGDWLVWHQSLDGVDRFLKLNDNTVPQSQASNVFLSVDSNTFGTGDDAGINSNGQQKIAYIWHDVPGLQKFGLWNGNGNVDGPFIETGFRPAIILYKDITGTGYWNIKDSSRTTYNGATHESYPATSEVENHHNSDRPIDFLSHGFKIRSANGAINDVNKRYAYAAWAEAPTVNLYGGQSNAR